MINLSKTPSESKGRVLKAPTVHNFFAYNRFLPPLNSSRSATLLFVAADIGGHILCPAQQMGQVQFKKGRIHKGYSGEYVGRDGHQTRIWFASGKELC